MHGSRPLSNLHWTYPGLSLSLSRRYIHEFGHLGGCKIFHGCTQDLKFVFWFEERYILGLDRLIANETLSCPSTLRGHSRPLPVSIGRRTQTGICGLISCLCLRIVELNFCLYLTSRLAPYSSYSQKVSFDAADLAPKLIQKE